MTDFCGRVLVSAWLSTQESFEAVTEELAAAGGSTVWYQQSVTPAPVGRRNSSQTVMSSQKHRGGSCLPYAFTEQGVAMLSSVLRSPRAVQVNMGVNEDMIDL